MKIIISDCEKQLSVDDIAKVERELSVKFPESIKRHFLKFNGGDVDEVFWNDPDGLVEPIELRDFIPMLYNRDFGDDQGFTLNGRTLEEWSENKLPKNLVQFAMDWEGNYFCIDCTDGTIHYFVRDFDDALSNEENFRKNTKQIAESFDVFMNSLVAEADSKSEKIVKQPIRKNHNKQTSIKALLKKIEKSLSEHVEGDEQLCFKDYQKIKGATANELEAFEQDFAITLPAEFKELYQHKNGSHYPFDLFYTTFETMCAMPFYMLSLPEIRKCKKYFCNESKLMSEAGDFFSQADIDRLDKRIKPYIFHQRWIPFAQMAGGSLYLMLDFDPAREGRLGQIIAYIHDPDFIYYVCGDIRDLLENTLTNLESGCYEELH